MGGITTNTNVGPNATWTTTGTWNGAVCPTCRSCYVGHHVCTNADILRRIAELTALLKVEPSCATPS